MTSPRQQSLSWANILLAILLLTIGDSFGARANPAPLELDLTEAFEWPQGGISAALMRRAESRRAAKRAPTTVGQAGDGEGRSRGAETLIGGFADSETIPGRVLRHSWPLPLMTSGDRERRLQAFGPSAALMGQLDALDQLSAIDSLLDESGGSSRLSRAYKPRTMSTARGFGKRSGGSRGTSAAA